MKNYSKKLSLQWRLTLVTACNDHLHTDVLFYQSVRSYRYGSPAKLYRTNQ